MSSFTEDLSYEFTGSYYKGNPIYVITKGFQYKVGDLENPLYTFTVPEGFETDLASIPFPLNIVFKPDGEYSKAAILHDYMITHYPTISRVIIDGIFLEAMIVLKVKRLIAWLFYTAVRLYAVCINRIL